VKLKQNHAISLSRLLIASKIAAKFKMQEEVVFIRGYIPMTDWFARLVLHPEVDVACNGKPSGQEPLLSMTAIIFRPASRPALRNASREESAS